MTRLTRAFDSMILRPAPEKSFDIFPPLYPGAQVEVWLPGQDGPEAALVVCEVISDSTSALEGHDSTHSSLWSVIAGGCCRTLSAKCLFRFGCATRPLEFKLPNVKNVGQALFVNDIISVQPMTAPTSKLFSMDFSYGVSNPSTSANYATSCV